MMQKFLLTRRSMLYSLVGMLLTAMLTLWGCGSNGSGSYENPTDPGNPAITTTKAPPVLSGKAGVDTLQAWIDEGKLDIPPSNLAPVVKSSTANLDRVVIVSPSTEKDWVEKGHIPGAVRWGTNETAMTRLEGLGNAGSMMPAGSFMDSVIQRLGIDGNTTIVISLPKETGNTYNQSLVYWDLRYWGFPKERVKILNGGDDAWLLAGKELSKEPSDKRFTSEYTVRQNSKLNEFARISVGEIITKVDQLIDNPSLKDTWQLIDVRGTTTSPYMTNALRQTNANMFLERVDETNVKSNFAYPDRASLLEKMSTLAVKDGDVDAFISPAKKTIAMCGTSTSASPTFVLFDAVLNVPEGNIALYDGSSTQWNNYSIERLRLGFSSLSDEYLLPWAFNDPAKLRAQGSMATSAVVDSYWMIGRLNVSTPADINMNQILIEDRKYMESKPASSGNSGNPGGGSAPAGC